MKVYVLVLATATLTGCMGSFVPTLNPDDLTPSRVAAGEAVRSFEVGESHPPVAAELGRIIGYSCRRLLTDPPATAEAALRELRIRAADLGGNGVIRVIYATHRRGINFRTNCWSAVRAEGGAVRFQ